MQCGYITRWTNPVVAWASLTVEKGGGGKEGWIIRRVYRSAHPVTRRAVMLFSRVWTSSQLYLQRRLCRLDAQRRTCMAPLELRFRNVLVRKARKWIAQQNDQSCNRGFSFSHLCILTQPSYLPVEVCLPAHLGNATRNSLFIMLYFQIKN